MNLKEAVAKIEECYKARRKGLVIEAKGIIDTDRTREGSIVFNNFDQIRGAIKLIKLLKHESKTFKEYFHYGEEVEHKK